MLGPRRLLKQPLAGLLVCAVAVLLACGGRGGDDVCSGSERFCQAVRAAQENYTVYWLGPSVRVPDGELDRIDASSVAAGAPEFSSAIHLNYAGPNTEGDLPELVGRVGISTFSRAAWDQDMGRWINPPLTLERREIDLAAMDATFVVRGESLSQPTGFMILAEARSGEVILIETQVIHGRADGRDVNPLMDEDLFLEVARTVRPYPD